MRVLAEQSGAAECGDTSAADRSQVAEAETDVRPVLAWTGMALFYLGPILIALVGAWWFGRLAQGDSRVAVPVGLIISAFAVTVFGVGLALVSLDSPRLVPLGLGMIGLSLATGVYAIKFVRTRS